MRKVIGNEVRTLARVTAETAVPLFEPERVQDIPDSPVDVDGLFEGVDKLASGLKKKNMDSSIPANVLDEAAIVSEINEAAHRYDGVADSHDGKQEGGYVRSLNIF